MGAGLEGSVVTNDWCINIFNLSFLLIQLFISFWRWRLLPILTIKKKQNKKKKKKKKKKTSNSFNFLLMFFFFSDVCVSGWEGVLFEILYLFRWSARADSRAKSMYKQKFRVLPPSSPNW